MKEKKKAKKVVVKVAATANYWEGVPAYRVKDYKAKGFCRQGKKK